MPRCPSCQAAIPEAARFCPACGSAASSPDGATEAWAGSSETPTRITPPSGSAPRTAPPGPPSDSGAGGWTSGALLAGRYRIVGMLGRGGMGEVFRADDLTLGQSVALKFLPPAFARDADRLRRFYQEVRVAREVSHPNVCRVYDVGEADGRAFLSMEFIDGEDLSSLLRRIGRLPQEKGVEIARQLCAGLAALHERGIVHRDLKPANVMLDGRGRVRLTDFGLAALAEDVAAGEVRAGTPAYMAPEQLRGERVDVRSDLFSLGLVLYELFTGKRAFVADTPAELSRLHRESAPRSPSTILPGIDPAIERVLSRCLEKEPAARPSSALVVAAALPGGDPLAAALAAGEIPSLEMVAAAGAAGGIRTWTGALCLAAVAVAVAIAATVGASGRVHGWDPMEKSPEVLRDRAAGLLTEIGHAAPREDRASGIGPSADVIRYLAAQDSTAHRWETLRDARPAAAVFWYRESPVQMIPWRQALAPDDPPMTHEGMANVELDTRGRLLRLEVVPPASADAGTDSARTEPDWSPLFRAAGLDTAALRPAAMEWTPPHFADTWSAWTGRFPEDTTFAITVEAAAFRGKPTYFSVSGPWTPRKMERPEEQSRGDRILEGVLVIGIFAVLVGAFLWAVRNVRSGRGDRVGARRLTSAVAVLILLNWALEANHSPRPQDEVNFLLEFVGRMLVAAGLLWSFYVALEPYVRRTWPERIVGWSRVLTGRFRDPLVGRDILVGGVWYFVAVVLHAARLELARWIDLSAPTIRFGQAAAFAGAVPAVSTVLAVVVTAVFVPMFLMLYLLGLRGVFRNLRAAAVVFVLSYGVLGLAGDGSGEKVANTVLGLLSGAAMLAVLLRFGLLAAIAGRLFLVLTEAFPLTFDGSKWYAGNSAFAMAVILALAVYGLWIARSGKPLLRE